MSISYGMPTQRGDISEELSNVNRILVGSLQMQDLHCKREMKSPAAVASKRAVHFWTPLAHTQRDEAISLREVDPVRKSGHWSTEKAIPSTVGTPFLALPSKSSGAALILVWNSCPNGRPHRPQKAGDEIAGRDRQAPH